MFVTSLVFLGGPLGGCATERPSEPPVPATPAPRPEPLALPSGTGAMAPHLAPDGPGLRLTWFQPDGDGHVLLTATGGADGWSEPVTVARSDRFFVNWADTPSVVRGGDGALYAHFAERSGDAPYAYDVALARSVDGAVFERIGTAHDDGTETEHGFVSLVPVPEGVAALWLDGRATAKDGSMALRTATIGERAGPSRIVDDRVCDCCGTAATTSGGSIVAVWRDRGEAEHRDIRAVRLDGSPPVDVGPDGWQIGGCPVNGPRLVALGAGGLVAAWTTGAGGVLEVRAAASSDGGRSFGPAVVLVDGHAALLGRVDLVGAGDGTVLASWLAGTDGDKGADAEIRVRRLAVAEGRLQGGGTLVLGRASGARATGFPRMAVQDDVLVAVWTDQHGLSAVRVPAASIPAATDALKGALEGVPTGATEAPATLRPALQALDPDGRPWRLTDVKGPALINVWATWCGPCRRELPVLAAFSRAHPEIAVVGIAVDDVAERVGAVAAGAGVGYPVVLAGRDAVQTAFGRLDVPVTLLYDGQGILRATLRGAVARQDLEEKVALLSGGTP